MAQFQLLFHVSCDRGAMAGASRLELGISWAHVFLDINFFLDL